MRRWATMAAMAAAVVGLSGFSEADAWARFGGSWQMDDERSGTEGAVKIDQSTRTIFAANAYIAVHGPVKILEIAGESAVFWVGDDAVVVFSNPDESIVSVKLPIGPTAKYRRVK